MSTMQGKRVLITAGAGGIGRAIAEAFSSAGAKVFVCDISAAALGLLREQLPEVTTGVCDMADRGSVARMVDEAVAALGSLDVLVNNAGIAGPSASVADL